MKRTLALLLILALALSLAACGERADPNEGVYEAKSGSYKGLSVSVKDVFSGGFTLELKSGGKAVLRTGGQEYSVRWSLDGEAFKLTAADSEYTGTLKDGTMTLQKVLGSGMDLTLEKTKSK